MLRVLRGMNIRSAKQWCSAAALAIGLTASPAWAADMSTRGNPYPVGRPQQFSGTQSYGQAAYGQSYAQPARQPTGFSGTQQYGQHKYTGSATNPRVTPPPTALAPYSPFIPRVASRDMTSPAPRMATSPYSFAGTPLAAPAPQTPRPTNISLPAAQPQLARVATRPRDMSSPPAVSQASATLPVSTGTQSSPELRRLTPQPALKPQESGVALATVPTTAPATGAVRIPATVATPPALANPVAQAAYLPRPAPRAIPMPPPTFFMPVAPPMPQPLAQPYHPSAGNVASQFGPPAAPPQPRRQGSSLSSLVAFDQDLVPMDQQDPPPGDDDEPTAPPSGNAPQGITGDTMSDQVFGIAPESNTLQFLRAQSVLLEPGERQIDIGFEYAITEGRPLVPYDTIGPYVDSVNFGNQTVTTNVETDEANIRARQRLMLIPLEIRYGLKENVQVFCAMPFGWSNAELSAPGFDAFSNKVGIGDLNAGTSILLCDGGGNAADVIANFAFTAPTGDADFPLFPTTPFSQLGQGYWAVSATFLCIKTYDPCVVFYGGGYRHGFDTTFDTIFGPQDVDPGEQFIYQFGVGFAANETVTLSCNFVGMYIAENYINDIRVQGGILEPMQLRFAVTCAQECKIVEPFAVVGMTNDAPSARVGITWTF